MQKLELKYGRFQLDEQFFEILKKNDIPTGWYKQASKTMLSRYLTRLRSNKPNTTTYLILQINEEGLEMTQLTI